MGLAFIVVGMGVRIRGTLRDIHTLNQESPPFKGSP